MYTSGQIIATSHDLGPQMVVLVREMPLFQGNLGWWNVRIWLCTHVSLLVLFGLLKDVGGLVFSCSTLSLSLLCPPTSNIDTKNDGCLKCISFWIWQFLVSMLVLRRCSDFLPGLAWSTEEASSSESERVQFNLKDGNKNCPRNLVFHRKTRWWFQTFFYFHPYLGKWFNLTRIFQTGWNHQLEKRWDYKSI